MSNKMSKQYIYSVVNNFNVKSMKNIKINTILIIVFSQIPVIEKGINRKNRQIFFYILCQWRNISLDIKFIFNLS